ncbi:unnamed protein product [Meloidogyne enterolobii]|uniref:Uncharacterized protein n=1 Tax=Meloidogyne enterolobii TaxID=390850 RepID=A0ACB1ASB2_MELEN
MDPTLNFKNETTRVKHIHVIQANPESVEILDIKNNKLVTEAFHSDKPLINYFNHPMTHFGPMMATACKGKHLYFLFVFCLYFVCLLFMCFCVLCFCVRLFLCFMFLCFIFICFMFIETIQQHKLLQQLTKEKFDVGISEMYEYCAAALFHKLGVKTRLAAFAVPLLQMVGRKFDIPSFASFVPNTFASHLGLQSSFYYRFFNFYNEFYDWIWMDDYILREEEQIIRQEFGSGFPDLKYLTKKVSLVFFNSNPFFEMPRPTSNKVVYIGGLVDNLATEANKKLEPKIKKILDEAVEGAVLFSFGSIADTTKLNLKIIEGIVNAFRRFPNIQFIWKLDSETIKNMSELINSAPNIHTFEWLRQAAILVHPNLNAFITHCGQNSLTESVYAGVPIIGIPLFGDQFYNADVAVTHGIGLQIDVNELNGPNAKNILFEALERILQVPSFRQNAQILSKKLKLTPFKPKERLVKWVEFAAEFDDLSELDLPGDRELNWFIYYSLDVITFSIVFLGVILVVVWKFTKWILIKFWKILIKFWQRLWSRNRRNIRNITRKEENKLN